MKIGRGTKVGFTLIEILIAGAIMAILTGLAFPLYFKTVEQARSNEARINLDIIHAGQKIYKINNGVYFGNSTDVNAINNALSIDITTMYYTTVDVTANLGVSYTAKFTRNTVEGGAGSKWFKYDFPSATAGKTAPDLTEGGAF